MITYTFDALNRPTNVGGLATYAYDFVGNRTQLTDALGTTTYTYDALNRVTYTNGPTGALSYGYDLNDNRTSITYPGSLTVNYVYDAANRLTTVTDYGSRVTQYSYDSANRQTGIAYPNSVQAAYTYDDADRLLSLVHTHPVNSVITTAAYTLDNVGNRLTMVDLDGTTTYTYDNLHRLKTVTYPNGELVTYNYDPMGNRTSMTSSVHGTTTYSYDAGDRLFSFAEPGGTTNLTWDANGNMTGKGSGVYTFDALDRLTQVVNGPTTVQFGYTGDGVRLRKTINGTTTNYLQDLVAPLPIVLSETTGGQADRYVYGNDLVTLVSSTNAPAFYHTDGLGSTRALSNSAGQRTDRYSYDVFGVTRSQTGSSPQPYRFTGEQFDVDLDLIFLRMRYLDPEIGRFISRDQFEGFRDGIQSLNRYVYVENNPVAQSDPSGLTWQIFGALDGGFMIGPIKVGGGGKAILELNGGMPDVYLAGAGGGRVGFGLDASLGPKVGVAYEGSGGLGFLPDWMQVKGWTVKLPFFELGGTATHDAFRIEAALRTGVGLAYEAGLDATVKSGNLKGKLGDWYFNTFVQPRYDAQRNQMLAEHYRRMLEIYLNKQKGLPDNSGYGWSIWGGGAWGLPPGSGK